MMKDELINFLKENLTITIWQDYDGCNSKQINVELAIGEEIICTSQTYYD